MNVKHVSMLRDVLAELQRSAPHRFDMGVWISYGGRHYGSVTVLGPALLRYSSPQNEHGCIACLAGWTQLAFANTVAEQFEQAEDFAQRFLGLSDAQASHWFYSGWIEGPGNHLALALDFLDQQLFEAGYDPLGAPESVPVRELPTITPRRAVPHPVSGQLRDALSRLWT